MQTRLRLDLQTEKTPGSACCGSPKNWDAHLPARNTAWHATSANVGRALVMTPCPPAQTLAQQKYFAETTLSRSRHVTPANLQSLLQLIGSTIKRRGDEEHLCLSVNLHRITGSCWSFDPFES